MSQTPLPRRSIEYDIDLEPEFPRRSGVHLDVDFDNWTWLPDPAQVDVLLYADGPVKFDGGGFGGLTRVVDAVEQDPWFWVEFDLTTAHRGNDPSADVQNVPLDQVGLGDYDELWLFGYAGGNLLSESEVGAVESFMNDGGGVLTTGDHANLGQGISEQIPRAGKMREYPAPSAIDPGWNTTIRDGDMDGKHRFSEQSDATPQDVRLKRYPLWSSIPRFVQYSQPHSVLCGPDGPIDVFPDHQHEGEIRIPDSYPDDEWPSQAGYQPRVEPVAWGRIVDPDAERNGEEFPIVGVYDGHRADVGRVVADSTWHHWFDINLGGFAAAGSQGQHTLAQFEAYFRNVAVWLAPPGDKRRMRNALTWGNFWFDPLVMLDVEETSTFRLGGTARDAFGRLAPQCTVTDWVFDPFPPDLRVRIDELRTERFAEVPEPPLPVEELVLGETVRELSRRFGDAEDAVEFPGHDVINEAYAVGAERAVQTVREYYGRVAESVQTL